MEEDDQVREIAEKVWSAWKLPGKPLVINPSRTIEGNVLLARDRNLTPFDISYPFGEGAWTHHGITSILLKITHLKNNEWLFQIISIDHSRSAVEINTEILAKLALEALRKSNPNLTFSCPDLE